MNNNDYQRYLLKKIDEVLMEPKEEMQTRHGDAYYAYVAGISQGVLMAVRAWMKTDLMEKENG